MEEGEKTRERETQNVVVLYTHKRHGKLLVRLNKVVQKKRSKEVSSVHQTLTHSLHLYRRKILVLLLVVLKFDLYFWLFKTFYVAFIDFIVAF
jgi:hypothetical protein